MKKVLVIWGCFLFSGLAGQGIRDSVFHIRQVDITAGRFFIKEEAGLKETAVDTFILNEKIHLNLSDLLSENTTVHIKDYGRGALSTASFRGTAPSHTQVTWNGININSPMLGMVDFSLIPVFIMDEIGLQHGAASVSSQSGGLGGLIRIRNKPDWQNKFSGRYYQAVGSFLTLDEFARFNIGNRKLQYRTRIYHNYSRNDYEFVNKHILEEDPVTGELFHPVVKNENARYRKYGVTQELYYRPSPNTMAEAQVWFQDASRSIPTVLSSEFGDTYGQRQNRQSDQTLKAVAGVERYGEKARWRIHSGFDYQQLGYLMTTMVNGFETRKPVNSESRMISWYNRAGYRYAFNDRFSIRLQGSLDRYDISTLDSATQSGYRVKRLEGTLFGGAYFSPLETVQLSAQIRKDLVEGHHTPVIYTFGWNLKPVRSGDLVIKGNLARNFHHPTLNDLYWQPGGNPGLLPEEGHTAEIGILYRKQPGSLKAETELTGYYSVINNWILWIPNLNGYWEPMNVKKVNSYGMEYRLQMDYVYKRTRFRMNGNMALTRTLNEGDPFGEGDRSLGKQLPYIPVVSGNLLFSVIHRGFYLTFHHRSIGRRSLVSSGLDTEDRPADNGAASLYTLYPHFMNRLSAGKELDWNRAAFSIELAVHNLFNETYRNILQRFMPGRHYTLMLKVDF